MTAITWSGSCSHSTFWSRWSPWRVKTSHYPRVRNWKARSTGSSVHQPLPFVWTTACTGRTILYRTWWERARDDVYSLLLLGLCAFIIIDHRKATEDFVHWHVARLPPHFPLFGTSSWLELGARAVNEHDGVSDMSRFCLCRPGSWYWYLILFRIKSI